MVGSDDWTHERRLDVLLAHERVSGLIHEAAASSNAPISAEQWMRVAGKVWTVTSIMTLGARVPVVDDVVRGGTYLGGQVGRRAIAALGVRVSRSQTATYPYPVGQVLVALMCALARRASPLLRTVQHPNGCVIESKLRSNALTWDGRITSSVIWEASTTTVGIGVRIPGQAYDWGRGNRLLAGLHSEIAADLAVP